MPAGAMPGHEGGCGKLQSEIEWLFRVLRYRATRCHGLHWACMWSVSSGVVRPRHPSSAISMLQNIVSVTCINCATCARRVSYQVAVKVVSKARLSPTEVTRTKREVQVLHHLAGHPNIVNLKV